ncbi:MAG: polyribonucleotide nucleotidyltransferase, partial [Microthrixaceae bacterium]|nr:polyribonucleotide nucleotidyltransferase [Microthrixaceae bacterium]
KIGGGKRIDKVEDVLDLGDAVSVVVDDIDPNGKISLSMAGDSNPKASEGSSNGAAHSEGNATAGSSSPTADSAASTQESGDRIEVNFGEHFDAELTEKFGDLGPGPQRGGGANRSNRNGGRNQRRR